MCTKSGLLPLFFVLPCVPLPSPCPRGRSHLILLSIPTPTFQHTFPHYMCRSPLCFLVGPPPDSIKLKTTANFVFYSDRRSFPFAWTLAHFNRFQTVIAVRLSPDVQFLEDMSSPSDVRMTPRLKGSILIMLYPTRKPSILLSAPPNSITGLALQPVKILPTNSVSPAGLSISRRSSVSDTY